MTPDDPWAKYARPAQASEQPQGDPWAKYARPAVATEEPALRAEQPEGIGMPTPQGAALTGEGLRQVSRSLARGAETILGLPGDIAQIPGMAVKGLATMAFPEMEEQIAEAQKAETAGFQVPGQEQLREITKSIGGEYLEPQSDIEELADEAIQTTLPLFVGAGGASRAGWKTLAGIGSVIARETAEKLGVGEGGQAAIKLGTLFMGNMLGHKGLKEIPGKLYDRAAKSYPKKHARPATRLTERLKKFIKEKKISGVTKEDAPVIKRAQDLLDQVGKDTDDYITSLGNKKINLKKLQEIKKGKIKIKSLTESNRKISSDMGDHELFTSLGKDKHKSMSRGFGELKSIVKGELSAYGKKNPKFLDFYNRANDAYAALAKSNFAETSIMRALSGFPKLSALIGGPIAKALKYGTVIGKAKSIKPLLANPDTRKHYIKMVTDAASGNTKAMAKDMKVLEKYLSKQEKKK